MNTVWKPLRSFRDLGSTSSAFAAAAARAERLNIEAVRLAAAKGASALAVPLVRFSQGPSPVRLLQLREADPDDESHWLLFISNSEILRELDELVSQIRHHEPCRAALISLAIPDTWATHCASVSSDLLDLANHAGVIELEGQRGETHRFELRAPTPVTRVQQLRALGPGKLMPEGRDNLRRREEWFRGKSGV